MSTLTEIKVLYIEDDLDHAYLIEKLLESSKHAKYIIKHRGDLESSIEYLKSIDCDVDAILLDLMLPDSEGVDTFKRVYETCKVPIVIISGYEDIAEKCIELGAQDYLVKPDISPALVSRSLRYSIERKKLLNRQVYLEKQFSDIIHATPLGVHLYELVDGELYFCGYNNSADRILKIDHSSLVGMKIQHAFPDVKGIKQEYIKVIKTGESWVNNNIEYKDDKVKGNFSVYAFRINDGRMATTFEDITIKSKMRKKLKEKEEKFRELVEVTKAAIYEIDFDTNKFLYVNDQICNITGYTREELLNMNASDILTEESLEHFIDRVSKIKAGEPVDHTFEYQLKLKNGNLKWTLITARYKKNDEGMIIGANSVAIDITEKKNTEEKMKQHEEIIFNELERKIHDWRQEINLKSLQHKLKLDEINLHIQSMSEI